MRRALSLGVVLFCVGLVAYALVVDGLRFRVPDVPFVVTPPDVVEAMLELAEVKEGDVVYDLGCGDGRIPIAAAKKYGVQAWGFDLDTFLVRDARANARKNGVANLVTFRRQDIFTLDLTGATVVTLYLSPSVNVRLIPQLDKLPPGCRIVSYRFDMKGVKPRTTTRHPIYLWVTPLEKEEKE